LEVVGLRIARELPYVIPERGVEDPRILIRFVAAKGLAAGLTSKLVALRVFRMSLNALSRLAAWASHAGLPISEGPS
jgi:hypothetical protein